MTHFRWLLLPAVLALGLATGTMIGFTADRAATATLTSVRTESRTEYITETVEGTIADPREHKIQLSEATRFGKTYCTAYADEIVAGEVSDSGLMLKAQAIGELYGATSAAAVAIAEACSDVLPPPSGGG